MPPKLIARLTDIFCLLALALACLGLYGVTGYLVARRTSELGIRTALGATRANVIGMVLRGALLQVLCAVAIGLPAAIAAGQLLASQVYGVQTTDPLALGGATALLLACALIAASDSGAPRVAGRPHAGAALGMKILTGPSLLPRRLSSHSAARDPVDGLARGRQASLQRFHNIDDRRLRLFAICDAPTAGAASSFQSIREAGPQKNLSVSPDRTSFPSRESARWPVEFLLSHPALIAPPLVGRPDFVRVEQRVQQKPCCRVESRPHVRAHV